MGKTHVRENYEKADLWTHLQISNVLPLLTFFIGGATAFYILKGDMDVTKQKVYYLEQTVQSVYTRVQTLEDRAGSMNLIKDTKGDVQGVSIKGTPIPTQVASPSALPTKGR